jgi:hypothetical protein
MPAHEITYGCTYDAVVAGIAAGNASNDSELRLATCSMAAAAASSFCSVIFGG